MKSGFRLAGTALIVSAIFPCAIDTSPSFMPRHRPEKFDSAFVRGELGILVPTLSEKYKLIAWRYLSGSPLDQQERASYLTPPALDGSYLAVEQWRKARESAGFRVTYYGTGKGSRIAPGTYYDNCLPNAFENATRTLEDRTRRYPNREAVAAWVEAQDSVFQNCTSPAPVYPADPDPRHSELERADRMYQIAAAHFYAEDLDNAESRFRAIAADERSPWRDTAAYMIARTMLREGTLLNKADALEGAKSQMSKITSGPLHDSAQGMIGYIGALEDPGAVLKSLGDQLSAPHGETNLSPAMATAAFVLETDRFKKEVANPEAPEPFRWVHALESHALEDALQGWRQSPSDLWLVAALIHVSGNDAVTPELLDAATKVSPASPAFDTVTFHAVRLMIARGQKDAARRKLDILLSGKRRNLDSVDNAFRGQRMSLATSYDDFLRWAPRRPIGYVEDDLDPGQIDSSPIVDSDSVEIFNDFAPLPKLIEASESSRLPDWPRSRIAISAWTRAFVLGNDDAANRLTPTLEKVHPAWAADLGAFQTATGDAKRFAGAVLISKHGDFHPYVWSDFRPASANDAYGPDWWCPEPLKNVPARGPSDAVLSQAEQNEAVREVARVHDSGSTQVLLAPIIIEWAKAHPDDPRVPEALGRLVRITRYGCRPATDNGRISKAAFDLLHKNYPSSEWARKTPYWFN